MIEFGLFSLCVAWLLCVFVVLDGVYCGVQKRYAPALVESLRRATILIAVTLGCSLVGL